MPIINSPEVEAPSNPTAFRVIGLPLSEQEVAVLDRLADDPCYQAYIAACAQSSGIHPRLRELAAAVFYGPPGAIDVALH